MNTINSHKNLLSLTIVHDSATSNEFTERISKQVNLNVISKLECICVCGQSLDSEHWLISLKVV